MTSGRSAITLILAGVLALALPTSPGRAAPSPSADESTLVLTQEFEDPGTLVGQEYCCYRLFRAAGGTEPYTWTMTGLPDGMKYDSSTGLLGPGTPSTVGSYPFTVTVTDAAGASASLSSVFEVLRPTTVLTESLPRLRLGKPYEAFIEFTTPYDHPPHGMKFRPGLPGVLDVEVRDLAPNHVQYVISGTLSDRSLKGTSVRVRLLIGARGRIEKKQDFSLLIGKQNDAAPDTHPHGARPSS